VVLIERAIETCLVLPGGAGEAPIAGKAGDNADESRLLEKVGDDLPRVFTYAVALGFVARLYRRLSRLF